MPMEVADGRKVWSTQEIRDKVATDPRWLERAVLVVYRNQTDDEQATGATKHQNGHGFNGLDAGFGSSLAEQILKGMHLTPRQLEAGRKMMKKYARQLTEAANINEFRKASGMKEIK